MLMPDLILQIHKEVKPFAHALKLRCVCVYGGGAIADQIADLKRGTFILEKIPTLVVVYLSDGLHAALSLSTGAEMVVATPGRMIDMLCANNGRVINLRRLSYLVLDEADRMFDLGFEPQINVILNQTRPDRQSVMFSATFPPSIEKLARRTLQHRPLELVVGGRSVVSSLVQQVVEVRPAAQRFLRLLQLLGERGDQEQTLIFVDSQQTCDDLFLRLLDVGYHAIVLHGGMDQADRDGAIDDFRNRVSNVLIATSIAARGLDVKALRLVVNYSAPNHYEDYVHRCGRTGRAGVPGTAVTFIDEAEERFSPELVKALTHSGQPVPPELQALADAFARKRAEGKVKYGASGFGGKSFGFSGEERVAVAESRKAGRAELGLDDEPDTFPDRLDSDDEDETPDADIVAVRGGMASKSSTGGSVAFEAVVARARDAVAAVARARAAPAAGQLTDPLQQKKWEVEARVAAAAAALEAGKANGLSDSDIERAVAEALKTGWLIRISHLIISFCLNAIVCFVLRSDIAARAREAAKRLQEKMGLAVDEDDTYFCTEIEINDYPQNARWKVSNKNALDDLMERYEVAIFLKGIHVQPGRKAPDDERKLYLQIEGKQMLSVKHCKAEIRRTLEEAALSARPDNLRTAPGKFSMSSGPTLLLK